jgi:hypothetical protein
MTVYGTLHCKILKEVRKGNGNMPSVVEVQVARKKNQGSTWTIMVTLFASNCTFSGAPYAIICGVIGLDKNGFVACVAESFVPIQNAIDTFAMLAICGFTISGYDSNSNQVNYINFRHLL